MALHVDNFVPHYFQSNVAFNSKTKLIIMNEGDSFNQVILKFKLPKLPFPLTYRSVCVYKLIKKITLQIGDKTILKFNSTQLEMFDTVERDFKNLQQLSNSDDEQVLYPIDMSHFFGECKNDKLLNDTVILSECANCRVTFEIKLGAITSLIQCALEGFNYDDCINELAQLDIIDAMAYVYYPKKSVKQLSCVAQEPKTYLDKVLDNNRSTINEVREWLSANIWTPNFENKKVTMQKINRWFGDQINIPKGGDIERTYQFNDIGNNTSVSKIILCSTSLFRIKNFTIIVLENGVEISKINIDPYEFRKIMNYNSRFTENKKFNLIDDDDVLFFNVTSASNQQIIFRVMLQNTAEPFVLDYLCKTCDEIIYHDSHVDIRPFKN